MKTFFSYVSVVLAALVIWAGCDSLVTPNGGDGLSGGDRELVAYSEVDPGVLAELEEAIRTVAMQGYELYEDNTACLSPPFSRDDVAPLHARLDQLLGQLGDDINRHNFIDHIADLDSADWVRLDSAAMNTLLQDYRALRAPYDAACPEYKELEELANSIFAEYADVIHSLGTNGFRQLVDSVVDDYATATKCKRRCRWRLAADIAITVGSGGVGAVACGGVTGTIIGIPAAPACFGATGTVVTGMAIDTAVDFKECIEACEKEEEDEEEELAHGIKPKRGLS